MALADYVFGPRIERRFEQQGLPTWTGGLLQQLLSDAALPALMGKDDIFGMSDVRGLLRWGDAMGINPDILNILGQVLPTFGDEQQRGKRENMPVFYKNWMQGNFPYVAPEDEADTATQAGGGGPGLNPDVKTTPNERRSGGGSWPWKKPRQETPAPQAPPGFPGGGGSALTARPSQASVVSQGPPRDPRQVPPVVSQAGVRNPLAAQGGGSVAPLGGKNQGGQQRQPIRPPRRFF